MEELREGIYLRGYGQQDPLVAYKREAHGFFEEMSARIASGVAQTILRVTVRTAEQAEREAQEGSRTATGGPGRPRSRRPASSLGGTSRAGAGPGRSSRSVTGGRSVPRALRL